MIDDPYLLTLLAQNPLESLLTEWLQAPAQHEDLDLLYEQLQLRSQILNHCLATHPVPEPSSQPHAQELLEKELFVVHQISEQFWHQLHILDQELDIQRFMPSDQLLNDRLRQLEAVQRNGYRLQALNTEMAALRGGIQATLVQIFESAWDSSQLWLLETRREHLLDRLDALRQEINLFESIYQIPTEMQALRTLDALFESLEESLLAVAALQDQPLIPV